MATDVSEYADFYLYVVWRRTTSSASESEIVFTRSTDFGNTWDAPYAVQPLIADTIFARPYVAYGTGGWILLAYESGMTGVDTGLQYRRAPLYADGGVASWSSIQILDYINNGVWIYLLSHQAVPGTDDVLLTMLVDPGSGQEGEMKVSTDLGASWPGVLHPIGDLDASVGNTAPVPASGEIAVGGIRYEGAGTYDVGVVRSSTGDPSTWAGPDLCADQVDSAYRVDLARDPTRGDRLAAVWTERFFDASGTHRRVRFDAEWFRDPGHPNLEPGFPVAVPGGGGGGTPPAVVDVDGDGDLEIVYAVTDGYLCVVRNDGTDQPGWPLFLPDYIPIDAPVAVGDLTNDGIPEIVTGTSSGFVYAFSAAGDLLPGWPVDLETGEDAYVSIGALGPPYARYVIAVSGTVLKALKYDGVDVSPAWGTYVEHGTRPAAIGDVDGDGVNDIVTLTGSWYHVHRLDTGAPLWFRQFPGEQFSDAPTLADLDGDGTMEVVAPTDAGKLHVLRHDGTEYSAAWPFTAPSGQPLTGAALANLIGNSQIEMAFADRSGGVYQLSLNGGSASGYPKNLGSTVWMPPAVDAVNRASSNVAIASTTGEGWSWENTGGLPEGWPKELTGDVIEETPACGDIDNDGHNEIVFLGLDRLWVVDVGYPQQSQAAWRWPMYQHDPQRTGCLGYTEDMTPVAGDVVATQVRFAPPWPNPAGNQAFFAFALPAESHVSLRVFDVRGREVRVVTDQDWSPGRHTLTWDGRNNDGRRLSDGVYLARLRVDGSDGAGTWTRKLMLGR